MTVISYTSDLTDINLMEATTSISAYGGGGAGLAANPDLAIEGTNCVDKSVGAGAGEEKGFMYDNTSNFTIGADDHFYLWIRAANAGLMDTIINRGIHVSIGDNVSNFTKFHVNGGDTLPFGGTLPYAIRFLNTAKTTDPNRRTLVGTPGTTPSFLGGGLNTTGDTKAPNLGINAMRIGTGYDITGGTVADPPGDFQGIIDDALTTREGVFRLFKGALALSGKLRFGGTSNECEFTDVGAFIIMFDNFHSLSDFNEILIEHVDTILTLDACTFRGIGTTSPGRFEMITSAATVDLTNCNFQDFGDLVLGTGASLLACNFINTDTITANGADLTGSLINGYEVAVDTSPLIWNVATDPDGLLDDMSITKGTAATHAIEFGTTSPLTMTLTGIDFSGYNASDAQNDSTFHVLRTTGTVTINIIGGSGNTSFKTAGATVVIVQNPVPLTITVTDIGTGSAISGARVYVTAGTTGPLPFEDSVTITRSGSTASVSHTAHGLVNTNKVFIEGAVEEEYNGVQTISNVSTNAYDYTVSGTPDTPATGTITSTAVIIDGTTNGSGVIADTRPYSSDQDIDGRVRQSTSAPFYITAPFTNIIDKDLGTSIPIQMVRDE